MRPFFYFLRRVERGGAERTRRSGRPTERENESFRSEDTRSVLRAKNKYGCVGWREAEPSEPEEAADRPSGKTKVFEARIQGLYLVV